MKQLKFLLLLTIHSTSFAMLEYRVGDAPGERRQLDGLEKVFVGKEGQCKAVYIGRNRGTLLEDKLIVGKGGVLFILDRKTSEKRKLGNYYHQAGCLTVHAELLICKANDKVLAIFDLKGARFLAFCEGHKAPIGALCAQGDVIYSGDKDGFMRLWDLSTGKERTVFKVHASGITALLIHQGDIIVGADTEVLVFDEHHNQKMVLKGPFLKKEPNLPGLALPLGALFAVGNQIYGSNGEAICLWDRETGKIDPNFRYNSKAYITTLECYGPLLVAVSIVGTAGLMSGIEVLDRTTGKSLLDTYFADWDSRITDLKVADTSITFATWNGPTVWKLDIKKFLNQK